ncbi:MAG TPA: metalloregulator ArsR/SmtB family transcription factor [Rhizomicrobium sp.]|jgi:DNA-binding transcriptional ArsR family regulator|nr:metalloregulator ArsR/SmtB family transcription factor [Rhizomicrobium sp.]
MESDDAITRMSALATPSRLKALKMLAESGEHGLASGELARRLDVAPNTLSTQLLLLSNARLVRSRRESRSIIYKADLDAIRELMEFLANECAAGRISANIRVSKRH